jgi:hypothetical protein
MMRLMYARFVNTNFSSHLILEEEDFKQVKKREPKGDEELKWLRYKRLMLQTMKVKTFQLGKQVRGREYNFFLFFFFSLNSIYLARQFLAYLISPFYCLTL